MNTGKIADSIGESIKSGLIHIFKRGRSDRLVYFKRSNTVIRLSKNALRAIDQIIEAINLEPSGSTIPLETSVADAMKSNLIGRPLESFIMYVTGDCNMACNYCYSKKYRSPTYMEADVAKNAIRYMFRANPIATVNFFGGEPLLNLSVIKVAMDEAVSINPNVVFGITTNGTIITEDTVQIFDKYAINLLVSIDGPASVHDVNRKFPDGGGTFNTIRENLHHLVGKLRRQSRVNISIRATLDDEFIERSESIKKELASIFPWARIYIGNVEYRLSDMKRPTCQFNFNKSELLLNKLSNNVLAGKLSEEEQMWLFEIGSIVMRLNTSPSSIKSCGIFGNMTTVSPEGYFYPCHKFVDNEAFRIGDYQNGFDQTSIERIILNYVKSMKRCSSCWAFRLCGGQCPYYYSAADGSFLDKDCGLCKGVKKSIEHYFTLMSRLVDRERGSRSITQ